MLTKIRLRSAWAIVPIYLLLAEPSVALILVGLVFALLGGLVRGWAAGAIKKNKVLTTHGPYAFTRNPLYVGSFLIGTGFSIASGRIEFFLVFLLFFVLVYGRTMVKEEGRLERLFGEEFRRYRATVPRFLPRVPPWSDVSGETSPARQVAEEEVAARATARAGHGPFQLQRYLANREYQAMLGMGIMFLLLAAKLAF